jgi:hypothetical protein
MGHKRGGVTVMTIAQTPCPVSHRYHGTNQHCSEQGVGIWRLRTTWANANVMESAENVYLQRFLYSLWRLNGNKIMSYILRASSLLKPHWSDRRVDPLGCNAMDFAESLKFRRNISLPSSGPKTKPSKKLTIFTSAFTLVSYLFFDREDGGYISLRNVGWLSVLFKYCNC